jgi:hypothetical protein
VDSLKNKVNKNLLFEKTERKIRLMDAADSVHLAILRPGTI